jgi:hypothetical protein
MSNRLELVYEGFFCNPSYGYPCTVPKANSKITISFSSLIASHFSLQLLLFLNNYLWPFLITSILYLSHSLPLFTNIYLWSKVVCLFCFVLMRFTELGCFRSCSRSLCKVLEDKGCIGLVPCHLNLRCKSSWILNNFFTENLIKS